MPIIATLVPGEGVRIDATDIWMLNEIIDNGAAAIFLDPNGREVVIRQNITFRVGPGFRMSLAPGAEPGQVRLSMEAYIPLTHRHPPRNHKLPRIPSNASFAAAPPQAGRPTILWERGAVFHHVDRWTPGDMKIDPTKPIHGVDPMALKKLFRVYAFQTPVVMEYLQLNEADAKAVMAALEADGWVSLTFERDVSQWEITLLGYHFLKSRHVGRK